MAEEAWHREFRPFSGFDPDERLETAPAVPPGDGSSKAAEILRRRGAELLEIQGVQGVGVGRAEDGGESIVVYVADATDAARVPDQIESHPVNVVVTGPIGPLHTG